jgi:hypothetical protein
MLCLKRSLLNGEQILINALKTMASTISAFKIIQGCGTWFMKGMFRSLNVRCTSGDLRL